MNPGMMRGVGVLTVGLLTLGGCADEYNREAFIDDLAAEEGIGRAEATCITDGLEEKLGADRLKSPGSLTKAEERVAIEITFECLLGL